MDTITDQLEVYYSSFFGDDNHRLFNPIDLLYGILQFNVVSATPQSLMLERPDFLISSSDQLNCCFMINVEADKEIMLKLLGPPVVVLETAWVKTEESMQWRRELD